MYRQERLIKIAAMHKEATTLDLFISALKLVIENADALKILAEAIKSCLMMPKYRQKAINFIVKALKALTKLKRNKKQMEENIKDKLNIEYKKVINLRKEKNPELVAKETINWLENLADATAKTLEAVPNLS